MGRFEAIRKSVVDLKLDRLIFETRPFQPHELRTRGSYEIFGVNPITGNVTCQHCNGKGYYRPGI